MAIKTGGGFLNEINVTPFVDVMLVLLIIFMVTAPLMTQGVEVDLPTTRTVKNLPQDSEHLVLSIKGDGIMFLDEYQVAEEDLEGHLTRLVAGQKKQLFLRADAAVPYGTVVRVMGEIKAAGIDPPRHRGRRDAGPEETGQKVIATGNTHYAAKFRVHTFLCAPCLVSGLCPVLGEWSERTSKHGPARVQR